jgi:ketosteroid isomerase-like protein
MQNLRASVGAAFVAFPLFLSSPVVAASNPNIAIIIKADVAEMVAGINAHDPERATKFDAPDLVSMESMREPSIGSEADRQGLSMAFKYSPNWQLSLIEETVDVSDAGEMAVYRSTYNEDSTSDAGVPMTHKVNYIAGFKHDTDGIWRIHWSVVCAQSRSHKK